MIGSFVEQELLENIDPVCVDLKDETLELVAQLKDISLTKSKAHQMAEWQELYGDLPESQWPLRDAVENHFLMARPDQKHTDWTSSSLPHPHRSIVYGTNGYQAFALQGDERAVQNLLQAESAFENKSFEQHLRFQMRHLHDQSSAMLQLQEFKTLSKVDSTLQPALTKMGPFLSDKLKTLPAKGKPIRIQSDPRPTGSYAGPSVEVVELHSVPFDSGKKSVVSTFRLLVCRVPHKEGKATGWKDQSCEIVCHPGTAPSLCFNKTHVCILYQLPHARGMLRLECIEIGAYRKRSVRDFFFPRNFAQQGMLCTTLSDEGIFAVALGNSALIIQKNQPERVVRLSYNDMPAEERKHYSAQELNRIITSLRFQEGLLWLGSNCGEAYGIEWETGTLKHAEHVPQVIPVFGTLVRNQTLYMSSVQELTISPQEGTPRIIECMRPLAVDVCGALVAVMTKYGALQFFHKARRNVMHSCLPVKPDEDQLVPHAYQGVKCFEKSVVCVYPNGVVRKYSLQ